MNILITPGTYNASLTIMESLAKQGHHIFLLDSDAYCAGFRSKYCRKGIVIPPETKSEAYICAIERLISLRHFDLLIPTSDCSTEILSGARERITPYVRMLLPSKELIELARYKDKTYRFALDNKISIPSTYFPKTIDEVVSLAQYLVFPCIAKKPRGTGNKGNYCCRDAQSLIAYYNGLTADDEWPVIQEFIKGDFYGFLGVAHEGHVIDCMMYKTKQQFAGAGSMAAYVCSVTDEVYLNIAKRIVRLLDWTGAINIDFLQAPDGDLLMLEINPRLSGSLTFAYKLGVDLPSTYRSLAFGEIIERPNKVSYASNQMFRYVLPAEIIYALNHKGHFFNFFLNFLNFSMKTDIPWDDHALMIAQLWHVWWYQRDRKETGGMSLDFLKQNSLNHTAERAPAIHAAGHQGIL